MKTRVTRIAAFLLLLPAGCDCGHRAHGPGDELPPDCGEEPRPPGCECDAAEPEVCYEGPAGTASVGVCRSGIRTCVRGSWTDCEGAVPPGEESCNGLDDDCDGETDEGVLSACGDCAEGCEELRWGHGEGETPFDPDEGSSEGVTLRDPGALVLEGSEYDLDAIWIPNSSEGTISRVSTSGREELARYRTGPLGAVDNPSRTSVDYQGNAYVANRAFGQQASVTKIFERDCPDSDGNGRVQTSEDRTDVLEWGEDECVAWNTPVGAPGGIARAVAVQTRLDDRGVPETFVWTGLYAERRVVELDAETGEATGVEVATPPGCDPYGAAVDRDGLLWISCGFAPRIAWFDTRAPADATIVETPEGLSYGITVDAGGRIWVGGYYGYSGGLSGVYDPAADVWTPFDFSAFGVAVDARHAWFGGCSGAFFSGTCRVDLETLEVSSLEVDSNRGVAVDLDGFVWAIPNSGRTSVVDPETDEVEPVLQDCDGVPTCLNGPYVYSDMTGLQLRIASSPEGHWETVAEGCADGRTRWTRIDWDVETPDGTSVTFQVRGGDDLAALESAPWTPVATAPGAEAPVDLEAAIGEPVLTHLLGIRVVLSRTGAATPVVHSVRVQRSCPGFA